MAEIGAALVVLGLVTIGFVSGPTAGAAPLTLVDEPFNHSSTLQDDWISGGSACLTSSGVSTSSAIPQCSTVRDGDGQSVPVELDSTGTGALRLTSPISSDSGFAWNSTAFDAGRGLRISFDQYQWGGNGADGIVFFLIDGAVSPTTPGASGGALGYADSDAPDSETALPVIQSGLKGAVVGVGFDSYGNFSGINTGPHGTLGPGSQKDSIAIRGSEASNYGYIAGRQVAAWSNVNAEVREDADVHTVITISARSIMSITATYTSEDGPVVETMDDIDLRTINGQDALPSRLKLGFSAGTGADSQFNEINNLAVSTLAPDLSMSGSLATRTVQTGLTPTFTVANLESAGSTDGVITFSSSLPDGLTATSASGVGWACTSASTLVTCTRSASGAAALAAGASLPPISIGIDDALARRTEIAISASVAVGDDGDLRNNTARVVVAGGDTGVDPDPTAPADPADPDGADPAVAGDSNDPSAADPSGSTDASAVSSVVRPAALGRTALASTGSADAGIFAVLADVFILAGFVLIVIGFRRSLRHSRHRR